MNKLEIKENSKSIDKTSINQTKNPKKSQYKSSSHHKYSCNYHFILVCKYRKKLLIGVIRDQILSYINYYFKLRDVTITAIESDKDHIHFLIDYDTNIEPHKFILYLKQYTTFHIWKNNKEVLEKQFWKERTFWLPSGSLS